MPEPAAAAPISAVATARIVFGRELRAHARTFALWFAPMTLLLGLMVALQPSMAGDDGVLAAKLAAMPDAMKRAFGLTAMNFARPPVYLSMVFVYVTLTASLFAGILGATIIAKEEALGTAELLLAAPIGRGAVIAGKAAALGLYAIAFNVGLAALAIALCALIIAAPTEPGLIAALFAGTGALALCFAGLGMLLATVLRTPRHAGGAALGVVLGAYLISMVSAAVPGAAALGRVSPFRAVDAGGIVLRGGVDPVAVAVLVAVGAAGAALAVHRFRRRDIHA